MDISRQKNQKEKMEISLVSRFDDLQRCNNVLTDGTAEKEYRRFLAFQEESRAQWLATLEEAQRLQKEHDKCNIEKADLESKLYHARRMLEIESKARRSAELERDALEKKLCQVCEFLRNDQESNSETRSKLADLDKSARKRKSKPNKQVDEKLGHELNSTGSFLSNLSVTQSEDDYLEIGKPFKKHRASVHSSNVEPKYGRTSKKCLQNEPKIQKHVNVIDMDISDRIVATTKVSIPQGDGPIEATSTIEAVPNSVQYNNQFDRIDIIESTYETTNYKENDYVVETQLETHKQSTKLAEVHPTPNAPPMPVAESNPKLLLNLQGRQHEFSNRTMLRQETCFHCAKKIRFASTGLKCSLCSVIVHQDCKVRIPITCVPKGNGTPAKHRKQGFISEYVPTDAPMIPGLIVHCVNEVETRGLTEEGIYRVSGSQKEIKALKERFLYGKCVPSLVDVDIHVICGCIKDFLRDLREPLIPTTLWTSFANAVQNFDDKMAVRDIHVALNQLPQANRDTLAFLILHLQRVSTCLPTKMSMENLAKVFGPTVVGYSSANVDDQIIFSECIIQKGVMENLLNIPTDYWARFLTISDSEPEKVSVHSYFGTPGMRISCTNFRRDRKLFETPPYITNKKKDI